MADLGDAGFQGKAHKTMSGSGWYGLSRQPLGNTFSIATGGDVGLYLKGNYVTSASGSVSATFYDVDNGEYVAMKPDGSALWSVVVTDGGATVTPLVSGSAGTKVAGFIV